MLAAAIMLALWLLAHAYADEKDLAPPTVCAVPCAPPDVSPFWCAASAAWVEACAAMHEECRGWVMTHYGGEGEH